MGIAIVNHGITRQAGGATSLASSAAALTGSNLLVAIVSCATGKTVSGITDTATNTFTKVIARDDGSRNIELWYAKNVLGNASNTVTASYSASTIGRGIGLLQFSAISTGIPLDQSASGVAALSSSLATSSVTTIEANEVIIAGMCGGDLTGGSVTPGTNFTEADENVDVVMQTEYRILNAVGTYDASWTIDNNTDNWVGVMATFRARRIFEA